jgi:hypothetical protein
MALLLASFMSIGFVSLSETTDTDEVKTNEAGLAFISLSAKERAFSSASAVAM